MSPIASDRTATLASPDQDALPEQHPALRLGEVVKTFEPQRAGAWAWLRSRDGANQGVVAVDHVNLEVMPGEIFGVL